MKTLLILRHAKSDWGNSQLSDHDRPLNDRGKYDAPRMGAWLKRQKMVPELIISSTAERALTTAELVALSADFEGELRTDRKFYLAGPPTYVEILNELPDSYERVMVVGHNPGMEELVSLLTDTDRPMTTANVAVVELPIDSWSDLTIFADGRLLHHWQPRDLPER
ncbi:MAG: histidine phosphatase family protein [Ardenticatenaceae bacterium]|nr:histidine phosphatase family protein [Anaerolineales bacterium]MCB8940557.1 histidine phosphatase family protein [Ardenticatenaceae bacterium]MCB8973577.1 histidine phosphatase family protein [Ardenticatenaceae bacterium]